MAGSRKVGLWRGHARLQMPSDKRNNGCNRGWALAALFPRDIRGRVFIFKERRTMKVLKRPHLCDVRGQRPLEGTCTVKLRESF